jgi:hypothetical protein
MNRVFVALLLSVALGGSTPGAAAAKARIEKQAAAPAELEGQNFDGSWVFEVTTTVGSCPEILANVIDIRQSRVAAVDLPNVAPWGYVEGDGTLVVRFTRQDGRVSHLQGQLRGAAGSGAWSSSTDMCGGSWRASRGDAEHAIR